MNIYTIAFIIITIAILLGYLNHRFVQMQATIAIMVGSLLISFALLFGGHLGFHSQTAVIANLMEQIDFHNLLLNGMLSFLLFAGALTVDLNTLKAQKWEIAVLSTISTISSTFLIGIAMYYLLPLLGISLSFIYCLLFGALISPTDPIAVLATFKKIGASKKLEVIVAGESLFNDGVAIVIFLTIYGLATASQSADINSVSLLFLQQTLGGISYGALLGLLGYRLIKPINDHKIEILITLMIPTGGYVLAQALNISGPLAMVVAGLFIGNHGKQLSMSHKTQESLDTFWEIIDEILNAILFMLIGLELLVISFEGHIVLAAILAILVVLSARWLTVSIPMAFFKKFKRSTYPRFTTSILIWGGLRGGLAVALALSLPENTARPIILTMTYAVVLFSIIIQGLSVKPLVKLSKSH